MTDRLYAKYIWLISTIHDAGKISFEDIARKWDYAYINTRVRVKKVSIKVGNLVSFL